MAVRKKVAKKVAAKRGASKSIATMAGWESKLAEMAREMRPGLLVLYHQLQHGVGEEELMREVCDEYDGPVVSGKDLEVY